MAAHIKRTIMPSSLALFSLLQNCGFTRIYLRFLLLGLLILSPLRARAGSCEDLSSFTLPDTTITLSEHVRAGEFALSSKGVPSQLASSTAAATGRNADLSDLPAFCLVAANVKTSSDSAIKIEVWLPEKPVWNRKFLAHGWAFYAGTMNPAILAGPLRAGYATATTDGGGPAGNASFLLGHPEKIVDWGERAWHETTIKSKAIMAAYYGMAATFSYWNGDGGAARQGLKEIQRFPSDYDGVALGGLAGDSSHFAFAQMWVWLAAHKDESSFIPPSKLPVIHQAALKACNAAPAGVRRGVIQDPEHCKFDPSVLLCRGTDGPNCLTESQVAAVRRIYEPVTNSQTKKKIFGPYMPGSELAWGGALAPQPSGYAIDFFKYIVFHDSNWDYKSLNFDADVMRAEKVDPSVNAVDPDLTPFVKRGGKLLLYGGWNDTAIPPGAETDYYRSVIAKMGGKAVKGSVRLFMVPGMGHFLGGYGPDNYDFDSQQIIEQWRENGVTPEEIVAVHRTNGAKDGEMLVCPYPRVAKLKGSGDPDVPSNFACN